MELIQQKSIKVLKKICDNILADPSQSKYHDLNLGKIRQKLDNHCMTLLYQIGFKKSKDGLRLKWECNDTNFNLLLHLNQRLQSNEHNTYNDNEMKTQTPLINNHKTQFVPALNFNEYNNDSYKHIIDESNISMNDNDFKCDLSICPNLKRITKILKYYCLYIKSKQSKPSKDVEQLLEFGYNLNEINAVIAFSKKEKTDYNPIYLEDIYKEIGDTFNNVDLLNDFNHLLFGHS
eukprot:317596_1